MTTTQMICRPPSGDSNVRIPLGEQLGKLVCLLAHCNQSRCSSDAETENIPIIPSFLPVVSRLLEGPADEVTSDVRRRVFAGFTSVIKHHHRAQSLGGLEAVTDIIFRGLVDRDRSTRLASG
jgi:serine/threonine-protein kinase ATR